ncbi:MAG: DUF6522 family protein [Acetobacteraceae bacterium]
MGDGFATFGDDGTCTIDAEILAPRLGLTPAALIEQLRAGLVYQTSERGIGDDEGRMRLTFRYRHREFQAVLDRTGRLMSPGEVSCA